MVFGLALSIGALAVISQTPAEPGQLYFGLFFFAFNFLILVQIWYRYAAIMAALPMETTALVDLNLLLLFAVALEPYLLNLFAYHITAAVGEAASVLYAVDVAGMNAILAAFMHVLAKEETPLQPPPTIRRYRVSRNIMAAYVVIFLLSTLPVFWSWTWSGLPVRVVLWILTLPFGWLVRSIAR